MFLWPTLFLLRGQSVAVTFEAVENCGERHQQATQPESNLLDAGTL